MEKEVIYRQKLSECDTAIVSESPVVSDVYKAQSLPAFE